MGQVDSEGDTAVRLALHGFLKYQHDDVHSGLGAANAGPLPFEVKITERPRRGLWSCRAWTRLRY